MLIHKRKAKFSTMTKREYITRMKQILLQINDLPYGKVRVPLLFKLLIYSLNFIEHFPQYSGFRQTTLNKIKAIKSLDGFYLTLRQRARLDHYYRRLVTINNIHYYYLSLENNDKKFSRDQVAAFLEVLKNDLCDELVEN